MEMDEFIRRLYGFMCSVLVTVFQNIIFLTNIQFSTCQLFSL